MDYKMMLRTAMEQSAEDLGCTAEDFCREDNVIVPFRLGDNARKYLKLPIICNFVSYGSNVVAGVTDDVADDVREYVSKFEHNHLFETPNMHWLDERISKKGYKVCFMAEYFIFDPKVTEELSCGLKLRVLEQPDFQDLYVPQWSNALCEDRKHLDVLGVGAYDGDKLVGLAACSADCDTMWQVGVDVLPGYRRRGIAACVTRTLAHEIMKRGKVPFYCCAWSNIRSLRNALRSGFVPSWIEMTVKPASVVEKMNGN